MRLSGILLLSLSGMAFFGCMVGDESRGIGGSQYKSDYFPGEEKSSRFTPNGFETTAEDSLSTFGLDVDKAAYTFQRRKIMQEGTLPEKGAVRTEEFLNYFGFSAELGHGDDVFRIAVEDSRAPFRDSLVALRIGLEARDTRQADAAWNITMLVDISGSMQDRLDLVKTSMGYLVDAMRPGDKLSIATYAGGVTTVLEPTTLAQQGKDELKGIIRDLRAGGGTAMSDGLENAYHVNDRGFLQDGVNRIVVCSDGDANIGNTGWEEMLASVRQYKRKGITLSTLGFGIGNYNDANMEMLADRGNGNYYYIDSEAEAKRLFTEELTAMMKVVAWDAKIQVAFRAEAVKSYRLLGYENRAIADSAFKDDTTDAGEIGAGHTVTALYELVLENPSAPLGAVHLRYKDASGAVRSCDRELGAFSGGAFASASADHRFAFAVAEYAEILRGSQYTRSRAQDVAVTLRGMNLSGDAKREEFARLVDKAAPLLVSQR